jgi:small subunit ribosomal protein S16
MPAEIIKLRLARHGFRNNPFYHIVAIANHKPRDAMPLEKLGEYDPIPRYKNNADLPTASKVFGKNPGVGLKSKRIEWNVERIKWWLDNGAQPTETIVKLLERVSYLF